MWKAIGVQAELVNREVKVHYDELKQNNFDVARAAWVADYNDPQNFLYLLETRTGVQNYGHYSNPRVRPADAASRRHQRDQAQRDAADARRPRRSPSTTTPGSRSTTTSPRALVSQKLAGLRRQHQAHPSLALDGARASSADGARHIAASAGDRRADAAAHRHAQLLHDAAGAGRAVRPGAAASRPRSCATSSGPTTSTSRSGSNMPAISAACCAATSGPSYRTKDFTVDRAAGEGRARQLQGRRPGASLLAILLGHAAGDRGGAAAEQLGRLLR